MPRPTNYLCDSRGNPSRWVALCLAVLLGSAATASAALGEGAQVTGLLAGLFVLAFNVAFNRRPVVVEIVAALTRGTRRSV